MSDPGLAAVPGVKVNKLRATRAVATRYDKRDYMYRGTITLAAIRIWLRDPVSDRLRDTP